jgi:hypothetical protein
MREDSVYRDGPEAKIASAEARAKEAEYKLERKEKELENANEQINSLEKKREHKFSSQGLFGIITMISITTLGVLATLCLCIANNCSVLQSVGGSAITFVILGGISATITLCEWNDFFERY